MRTPLGIIAPRVPNSPNPCPLRRVWRSMTLHLPQDEIAGSSDIRTGQDVVCSRPAVRQVFACVAVPQRLVRTVRGPGGSDDTPTRSAWPKLAATIYEDVASPLFRAKERLRVFQNLRIRPTVVVNPEDASLSFTFEAGRAVQDLDETLERLLELPGQLAAERDRQAVLILDEFQEIADIDRDLPKLMRAVFQQQPEVAHVYLGSKRHMMRRIFSDENEPFWRSAKQMELGVIAPELFAGYIADQFEATGRRIKPDAVDRLLAITRGHPYATQELAYFLWQATRPRPAAGVARVEEALAAVLRSEHAHFSRLGPRLIGPALTPARARAPGGTAQRGYRRRFALPGPSTVQKALEALERDESLPATAASRRSASRSWGSGSSGGGGRECALSAYTK